jgi:hypothetical protein
MVQIHSSPPLKEHIGLLRTKTRLLTFKLTGKSLELLKIGKHSYTMREVLLVLTTDERQQLELILKRLSIKLTEYTSKQIEDWSP